ncbi:MAG: acyl-CoA dehydrogenase family protein [Parachlamydia sp.]|nr:acyl-CoA dehydrogenase family protein [Parachlamydia sp.]
MHAKANDQARRDLEVWQQEIKENIYASDGDFQHSVAFYLGNHFDSELSNFGERVMKELEPLVIENNLSQNLPRLETYDGMGRWIEQIVHHPSYEAAGNIIYSSRLLERMAKPGGLLEALAFMFLSSQAGEAGHNCPVACSAGMIRTMQKVPDFPKKEEFLRKLCQSSYSDNFTGAQFLTEIQGGSDVGQNAVQAYREGQEWRVEGEKWFCSNADAELIFMTARYDEGISGTKGLGLFLVPKKLESGEHNHYRCRRLKDKIGTRSMASGEIDFYGASAIAMGEPADGFKTVMENVLHISRLFNTFCILGMARRAWHIALAYAKQRKAFGVPIIQYSLVKENLARIKAENSALLASIFATVRLQDECDTRKRTDAVLLLRLLANLNKYLSALWSVEHIHHSLDVLAGNGAIESFSTIPRLLRDSIVCENWEGTHSVLRMQILRDILKYQIDRLFLDEVEARLSRMQGERLPSIQNALQKLKNDLELLKEGPGELQSFQIKSVVDQMAILWSALHLLNEGSDRASKLNSFDYFAFLHLNRDKVEYHQRHLDLIDGVLWSKS